MNQKRFRRLYRGRICRCAGAWPQEGAGCPRPFRAGRTSDGRWISRPTALATVGAFAFWQLLTITHATPGAHS
jgi:hypothetical protein